MKIILNSDSYMIVEKDEDVVILGIKTKQGKESYTITATLQKDHLDLLITQLVSMRARISYVEQE